MAKCCLFKANLAMLQEARCLVTTAQACHINKSQWGVDYTQGEHLFAMTLSSPQLNANVLLVKLRNESSEVRKQMKCSAAESSSQSGTRDTGIAGNRISPPLQ